MTAKSNNNLIFTYVQFILLIGATLLFMSCRTIRIKDKYIGNTSIEREFDEKGELIYYRKTNIKATGFRRITRIKTKFIKDHKTVELYKEKFQHDMWSDRILKSKRVVWDENRKKTVTRISNK